MSPFSMASWALPSLLASCWSCLRPLDCSLSFSISRSYCCWLRPPFLRASSSCFFRCSRLASSLSFLDISPSCSLSGLLLGLGHLARLHLLLELLELLGGLLEVAAGQLLGELVGRALAAHLLEVLELPVDLLGRAELLLPVLEGVGQRVELDHQLVLGRRGGLGQLVGLLLDRGQQLLGLGELLLVDRLRAGWRSSWSAPGSAWPWPWRRSARAFLAWTTVGTSAGANSRSTADGRRDQHDPGPAGHPQAELGGDVQVGHLADRVGDAGPDRRATRAGRRAGSGPS